jgi:MoxR-like ATPase
MAEASITHMGESRSIELPFFVIATQNPIEMEGVNPLPEAQLDRFAVKFDVPATTEEVLLELVRGRKNGEVKLASPLMNRAEVLACQNAVDEVFLPEAISLLIARLVARTDPATLRAAKSPEASAVKYGSSPRGAIWLARVARALAFLDGRTGVSFDDVQLAAPHVLGHRVILGYAARLDGFTGAGLVSRLYQETLTEILSTSGR